MLQISFEVKKDFLCLKKKMKHFCVSYFTSHSSGATSSRNLCPSFSSSFWLFWAFLSTLVISGSCLGFFQYPSLHLHLKKNIFPLHLDSLFPWQETKGRHCLWKSNRFQTCEHKVRLRESDALQIWRCCAWCRDGEIVDVLGIPALLLGWRSRNERQDSCRGKRNSFPVSLSTLSGLLGRRASRCLSAELQWILHKKL